MRANLLERFIAQECTPGVQQLLEGAIADSALLRPHFEFNRFEVTIERAENTVTIEDVLDATDRGTQTVSLGDFTNALSRSHAPRVMSMFYVGTCSVCAGGTVGIRVSASGCCIVGHLR
jgi:hypothetical protein